MKQETRRGLPIEAVTFSYILLWIPYIGVTRWLSTTPRAHGAGPLSGLQILPGQIIATAAAMYLFFLVSGWWRSAHRMAGTSLPVPTRWTALSGVAAGMIVVTVPLTLTFPDVSVPFALLLLRGDILIIAPIVDLMAGRKVRWYSWIASVLVLAGLAAGVVGRGSLHLPAVCLVAIVAYVAAYFARLFIMTRCAKREGGDLLKAYFVEEQLVTYPFAIVLLATFALLLPGRQGEELRWGFAAIWSDPALPLLIVTGVLIAIIGVMAALILLNPRENTFCVPLERSASVLGGLVATYLLAGYFHAPLPSAGDTVGALLLILAIVFLTVVPRLRRAAALSEPSKP